MKWPWNRSRPVGPSAEIKLAQAVSDQQLIEARQLRARAEQVGSSLAASRDANHYAMALAAILSSRGNEKP